MLKKEMAVGILISSILITSVVSLLMINSTVSIAEVPSEISENATTKMLSSNSIYARQISSQLGRTESVINAMAAFAEQTWIDNSIPSVGSYYHDESVLDPPPDIYFDSEYGRRLSHEYSGYKIAPTAFDEDYKSEYLEAFEESDNPLLHVNSTIQSAINRSAKMDLVFQQLYDAYPEHVWLYMGYELGFHRSFPWHGPYSRSYDPRTRPWYIGAVTGAKDVVVIMDKSGSMEGAPLTNTKSAMKSVLNTLGPKDRFSFLYFSGEVSKWSDSLKIASPSNIDFASDKIDSLAAGGGTNINDALIEALSILNTDGSSDRTPMIIFMTDGLATTGTTNTDQILSNIAAANTRNARIFVFGLGLPGDLDHGLLNDVGSQNDGSTVYVLQSEDLESAMNAYYQFFSNQIDNSISWSWPYADASGWGMVITASKSVVVNGKLIGVVGADLTLTYLVDTINAFKPTKNGYSFLFDSGGIAVIHPSFSKMPVIDWQEEEVRVPIETLETPGIKSLFEQSNLQSDVSAILSYGSKKQVVAISSIGETSMKLATVAPLLEFLDPVTVKKLQEINNRAFYWWITITGISLTTGLVLVFKYKEEFM